MCTVLLATPNWFDSHQYIAIWLEGIALLAILAVDLWVSWRQGKESLAQMGVLQGLTKGTRDSADAALLNAQAVINSERPWIVVSVRRGESMGNYVFTATNRGRTPAVFESGTFDFSVDSYPDSLPTRPRYDSPIAPDRTLIVQGDGFVIPLRGEHSINPESFITSPEMTNQVKVLKNLSLLFYGKVIYKDVFNRDEKEAIHHETRFCYYFDVSRGEFVRTGPEEYNCYT